MLFVDIVVSNAKDNQKLASLIDECVIDMAYHPFLYTKVYKSKGYNELPYTSRYRFTHHSECGLFFELFEQAFKDGRYSFRYTKYQLETNNSSDEELMYL